MDSAQIATTLPLRKFSLKQLFEIAPLLFSLLVACLLWQGPKPDALSIEAWHLFSIFAAALTAIILKALPMGAIALSALTFLSLSHTLTFQEAFGGCTNEIAWLIVSAFFIARGFIITGLSARLSYFVMKLLGKSSLGLGYGLVLTDLLLAPLIPSSTARSGGILLPMIQSLTAFFKESSADPRMGAFLTLTAFQGSVITSALFLTSMAGNPLIAELAKAQGVALSWGGWLLASSVPGFLSLLIVPWLVYRISPPATIKTPHAQALAVRKLAEMGPMQPAEWIMASVFFLLIGLWIAGPFIGLKATVAALAGVVILLISGILDWKTLLAEEAAWDTFIWFGAFVTLAFHLDRLGFTHWLNQILSSHVQGFDWTFAFLALSLVYFYSHYLFVSQVAHIGAMYTPLLLLSIAVGTPPALAALLLAFFSNLFGGLTHYGSGPAAVLFATGHTTLAHWWKTGAIIALVNITIWIVVGSLWWHYLGLI